MITFRVPSACNWRRASSHPPVSDWRLISCAAAEREVPAGMRSGAYSHSEKNYSPQLRHTPLGPRDAVCEATAVPMGRMARCLVINVRL